MSEGTERAGPRREVLIVGDPALSRGLMRMVLGRLGYGVTCVAGPEQAEAALEHARFTLVMVSLQLPGGGGRGLAFARRLKGRERGAAGPVLVFGDSAEPEATLRECRTTGLDGFLPKPISITSLVATVRDLTRSALDAAAAAEREGVVEEALPIDLAHFESFTDGDEQLERELGSLYLATASTYLAEMREALGAGRPWEETAHALKGASANLGAAQVAALAAVAERAPPSRDQVERIDGALAAVRRFFRLRLGAALGEASGGEPLGAA